MIKNNMQIIIIGASGFVGQNLTQYFNPDSAIEKNRYF